MESNELQSASTYVNNLLLSRGLLRDGKTIDFARLAQQTSGRRKKHQQQLRFEDGGEEDKEREKDVDTVKIETQVLNLVHEMVLKRDRDQTHQEHTAQTLLTLRSDVASAAATTRRLEASNADLARQLATHQAATRAAEAAARSAEASARALREEAARAKTLLAQVRAHCANDVRRRDLELARLKTHLSGQQRGSGTGFRTSASASYGGVVAPSCTIVRGSSVSAAGARSFREEDAQAALSVQDAEYSLRQESNEFLTQLSQSLSDENDALIALVRDTLATLRELQGISDASSSSHNSSAGDRGPAAHSLPSGGTDFPPITALPNSYAALSADLAPVLASLRDLLSTPSFVSIEEVQVRDEEIARLRDGWEKVEARWREAALMMQGWRRRMLSGGDTVNLDEVRAGLRLGEGLDGFVADSSEAREAGVGGWRDGAEMDREEFEGDVSGVVGEESLLELERGGDDGGAVDESMLDAALMSSDLPPIPSPTPITTTATATDQRSQSSNTTSVANTATGAVNTTSPTTDSTPAASPSTNAPPTSSAPSPSPSPLTSLPHPPIPLTETTGNIPTPSATAPTSTSTSVPLPPPPPLTTSRSPTKPSLRPRKSTTFSFSPTKPKPLPQRNADADSRSQQEKENATSVRQGMAGRGRGEPGSGSGSEDELASV